MVTPGSTIGVLIARRAVVPGDAADAGDQREQHAALLARASRRGAGRDSRQSGAGSRARCTMCSRTRFRPSHSSSRARACSLATVAPIPRSPADRSGPPARRQRAGGGPPRHRRRPRRRAAWARASRRARRGFGDQSGLPVAVEVHGEPRELAPDARLALYRTAQEALTNVRRHAAAERVADAASST